MKATKLPSGKYKAVAYLGTDDEGKRVQKSFTSYDAKHVVAMATSYVDKYKRVYDSGSFSRAITRFLNDRESILSPSTLRDYKSRAGVLRTHYQWFCAKNMMMIDADDMRSLVRDMQQIKETRHKNNKEPLAMSPKTIKNYIFFIGAVFRHAGVPVPSVDLPEKRIPDIYVPTDAEIRTLIRTLEGDELHIPVLLASFGPLRRGEICALDYPNDFNGNVIHVHAAVAVDENYKIRRKAPKTPYSNRFIEFPDFVIEAITKQGYITKLSPGKITSRFSDALIRAGLPHFRFHDLRHYCVSTLHAQGVPDAYIMQRGGWSTDNVLKRVYRHTLADQNRIHTEKALNHFENVFSGRNNI